MPTIQSFFKKPEAMVPEPMVPEPMVPEPMVPEPMVPARKTSDKKYYEKNKEKLMDNHKIYYNENKDKYSEYNKKYYESHKEILCSKIQCECGITFAKKNKARHLKSITHLAYEKGLAKNTNP